MCTVPAEAGQLLLRIARAALEEELLGARSQHRPPAEPWLAAPAATFVSLYVGVELQGCIGSIEPTRPLDEDVRKNAIAAACRDPRFAPLQPSALDDVTIEISLLSPREAVTGATEDDIIRQLVPHRDGVVVSYNTHRATFLPQVWEAIPDPSCFLAELKKKAGLPTDFWHPDLEVRRYQTQTWKQPAPNASLGSAQGHEPRQH